MKGAFPGQSLDSYCGFSLPLPHPTINNSLLVPLIIAKSHRGPRSREIISLLVIVRIFDDVPQVSARSERKRGDGIVVVVVDEGGGISRKRDRKRGVRDAREDAGP